MNLVKNKKLLYGIIFILLLSIFTSACSSDSDTSMDTAPSEGEEYTEEEAYDASDMDNIASEEDGREPNKVITTISISMQTEEFLKTSDKLNSLINKHKGYIEQSNISYNDFVYDTGLKYADYSIRIPRDNLDLFVNELREIGNIISENKNKRDITKEYKDTESRLRVLEIKEERILALLEKAEKMEDIIVLENQLSDIIYDKENLTGEIMDMDDQVDYSTVFFQLEEVAKLSSGGNVKTPFSEKIKNAFSDSFYFFSSNLQGLIIFLVYFLPYLIVLLIIGFLVYMFLKRKKKLPKSKDKNSKENG